MYLWLKSEMSHKNCGSSFLGVTFLILVTFESCRFYQRETLSGREERRFISQMNPVSEAPSQFA